MFFQQAEVFQENHQGECTRYLLKSSFQLLRNPKGDEAWGLRGAKEGGDVGFLGLPSPNQMTDKENHDTNNHRRCFEHVRTNYEMKTNPFLEKTRDEENH